MLACQREKHLIWLLVGYLFARGADLLSRTQWDFSKTKNYEWTENSLILSSDLIRKVKTTKINKSTLMDQTWRQTKTCQQNLYAENRIATLRLVPFSSIVRAHFSSLLSPWKSKPSVKKLNELRAKTRWSP